MPHSTASPTAPAPAEITRLADLSPHQWKSGIAAWLGWLFDGMEMHLYTVVATPFVAQLLVVDERNPAVGYYGSIIQAAFLIGWALGGGFFGRLGDRLGRARALMLTILTYALFTGLSFFAQTWWHLLICRFLAALGIGGEWAVGASLLAETWPRRWRPWLAAALQSAVNVGIGLGMVAVLGLSWVTTSHRYVFLIGVLPALLVLWIRRSVPEPEQWHQARVASGASIPGIADLFRGPVRRITVLTILVCSFSLTAHWAFMFWFQQHLRNLPELADWTDLQKKQAATTAMILLMVMSIVGNFVSAPIARWIGYRRTVTFGCLLYFLTLAAAYSVPRPYESLLGWYVLAGACSGFFALFTMYLPPLFPTLLRTTGAGFCYNIGRLVAAAGTIFFGLFSQVGDHRLALFYASFMFIPAAAFAVFLPEPSDSLPSQPEASARL